LGTCDNSISIIIMLSSSDFASTMPMTDREAPLKQASKQKKNNFKKKKKAKQSAAAQVPGI